jgi:hypothetical protein
MQLHVVAPPAAVGDYHLRAAYNPDTMTNGVRIDEVERGT